MAATDDTGRHQTENVRAVDGEKERDLELDHTRKKDTGGRQILVAEDRDDDRHDQALYQAEEHFKEHMGCNVRGHVKSRSVLSLYYVALLADRLDRIENADPDAGADQSECAVPCR